MARAGLDKNRKFQRVAQRLNPTLPGMGAVLARGLLETMWSAGYERADDHLGDLDDVENAAGWTGERHALANLLLVAGGDGASGFIEADPDRGGYRIHAFWEHAPPWVKVKADKAAARAAAGKTLADVRREAGKASQFKSSTANSQPVAVVSADRLPEADTAKNGPGTGRDGTGRVSAPTERGAVAPAGDDSSPQEPPKKRRTGAKKSAAPQDPAAPPAPVVKPAPSPMLFTIGQMLTALRETCKGQIIVDPFDKELAKRLTEVARSLQEAGCTIDDVRLAGEYAAAVVPTWDVPEPMGLSWVATAGKLSTLIGKARAWHERGRVLVPKSGSPRPGGRPETEVERTMADRLARAEQQRGNRPPIDWDSDLRDGEAAATPPAPPATLFTPPARVPFTPPGSNSGGA